jgi:hypothetical protein
MRGSREPTPSRIGQAELAIRKLRVASKFDRKAFAVLVLLRQRPA